MEHLRKMRKLVRGVKLTLFFVFALTGYAVAQLCVAPPAGLVSWWPGDGNANDIQGTNDGTLQGGATFATGKVGQAFSLDGVNDYVITPLVNFGNAYTLSAWIKTPSTTDALLISNFNVSVGFNESLRIRDGKTSICPKDINNFFVCPVSNTFVSDDVFHLVTGTVDWNSLTAKIYVDGNLEDSVSLAVLASRKTGNSGNTYIGKRPDAATSFFNGLIDEIQIFNRALTAAEILATFNAGSAGQCKPGAPVPQAPQGTLDLDPDVFAVAVDPTQAPAEPEDQFLTAFIEPPTGVAVTDIVPSTVTLSLDTTVLATAESPAIVDGVLVVLFRLNLTNVSTILGLTATQVEVDGASRTITVTAPTPPAQAIDLIELTVSGALLTGDSFSTTDAVRVSPTPGPEPVTPVAIDIKPGSDPNSLNLGSRGVVPVAILTTAEFEVANVAVDSVTFAGASPVGTPTSEDVDGDGDLDLVFHFATQDLDLTPASTTATLIGTTVSAVPFEGTDSVRIVPKKKGRK